MRIIAGRWRGRRWRFPGAAALRPTPDRVRETLFNWLQSRVVGARCLDLYAGSGALGLEALSRGAASVVFVESSAVAAVALCGLLTQWGGGGGAVVRGDALRYLEGPAWPADLVFLDPPFTAGLLRASCARLDAGGWLAPGARIYVEQARRAPAVVVPQGWQPLRAGVAGEVGYHLYASGPT
ncbi:MAG: 16S rRNA (guanine(966)-N(2))-methyltransferase RsmD [Gammaproteobacteria bacterium]|nr:16S rRNA (guanine(966)-N(2))-methyltransferase RsmD [Gammaproteobacteria bacterium]